jgi:hypothetical protein
VRDLLAGLINPEQKEQDVKLLMFGAVAVFGCGKLAWSPIDANWVNAWYGLCALVGLGGASWAAVDKWKGGKNATPPATQEGTQDKEGKP